MVPDSKTEETSQNVITKFVKFCFSKIDLAITVLTISVLVAVLYVTSPVWFFFLLCANPQKAAEFYNNFRERISSNESSVLALQAALKDNIQGCPPLPTHFSIKKIYDYVWCKVSKLFYRTWRFLWLPVIFILPMSIKRCFVETSSFNEHTVQTQMDYVIYQLKNSKGLPTCINENSAVFTALWNAADEGERSLFRKAWIAAGKVINDEQIVNLLKSDSEAAPKTLLSYFTMRTRTDEQMSLLINHAQDARICELICQISQQQKPTIKFIERVFTADNDRLRQQMVPIIDESADINAVSKLPQAKEWSKDSEPAEVKEWRKFCTYKREISPSAQAKMKDWQYEIFAQTEHRLNKSALVHLLATQERPNYLIKIMEYEGIATVEDTSVLAILKARPEFYDAYIEKKLELQESSRVGKV